MTNDIKQKKEILEKDLDELIKFVSKLESSQSIKIYENLIATLKTEIENTENLKQKCSSCGASLDPWEKGRCGPCKIADERIPEEE